MKQLTTFEMEAISGGYSWDFSSISSTITSFAGNAVEAVGSAVLGAVVGGAIGTLIGGTQSGANGGLLGFGLIGNGVGMFWGLLWGAIGAGVGAVAVGWDASVETMMQMVTNAIEGKFVPWSH